MSEINKLKKKIIHHLRISEEEIPIPQESKMRLGEILNRRGNVVEAQVGEGMIKNGRND
jgi:hypothetical protein